MIAEDYQQNEAWFLRVRSRSGGCLNVKRSAVWFSSEITWQPPKLSWTIANPHLEREAIIFAPPHNLWGMKISQNFMKESEKIPFWESELMLRECENQRLMLADCTRKFLSLRLRSTSKHAGLVGLSSRILIFWKRKKEKTFCRLWSLSFTSTIEKHEFSGLMKVLI